MAIKSTIYKVSLQVNDFNRDHYQLYPLSVALHPSETQERMMMRVLAYALNANEQLSFTKGLSSDDEPDLWQKSLSDELELWVELGLPDVKRIRKASGRAKKVVIYAYGGQGVDQWHEGLRKDLLKLDNVDIFRFDVDAVKQISQSFQRTMSIDCMIQYDTMSVTLGESFIEVKNTQMLHV